MRYSELIIKEAGLFWDKATDHLFIKEMVNGTLNKKIFANYLIQDYAFIDVFLKLISYTIAYSETTEQKNKLATFLKMITSSEDDYFIRSFNALDIKEVEFNPKKVQFCKSIEGFRKAIEEAIESQSYERCLIILFCAEAVYCEWACNYSDKTPEQFYFNEWILLHNNDYFKEFIAWLRQEVDNLELLNKEDKDTLSKKFKHICKLELSFFDEVYHQ